jgi:hypothetical protein
MYISTAALGGMESAPPVISDARSTWDCSLKSKDL